MMDLFRPDTPEDAERISWEVCENEHPIVRKDLFHSLLASFTMDDVRGQLRDAGLDLSVEPASERHYIISGRAGHE